jgi:hypothetical protein
MDVSQQTIAQSDLGLIADLALDRAPRVWGRQRDVTPGRRIRPKDLHRLDESCLASIELLETHATLLGQ